MGTATIHVTTESCIDTKTSYLDACPPTASLTSILLDGDLSEEQAADGTDGLGRLLIGHALAEAGQPPGGDVGGGEQEHRQAQAALAAARYPALSRVQQAKVVHNPGRIFELALDGLILALQAHQR